MTDWLIDTLFWTAGLIALVLVLRRPVARWFGPQMAYALWLLPALRLILPPLELPAWLNPAPIAPAVSSVASTASKTFFTSNESEALLATSGHSEAATDPLIATTPLPLVEIGIALWLIGAAIFLAWRFGTYFRLRKELLTDAREVGRSGKVRLLETPGTNAPLALGVLDKVVALPIGFMAQHDKVARDLAIAHELAHHEGHDLLVNFLVQPLFALHWFNPLATYGWQALRRDQESACDARVVAAKPPEDRAIYAGLIASFAAGPNVTLAAPMACPVLGDKSIIHRLRSLKMSDVSKRRRNAGRLMIGAAVLALPLTASITYAESLAPEPPAAPEVASVAPPAPPAPAVPNAPVPPAPPAPPAPVLVEAIVAVDPNTGTEREVETVVVNERHQIADGEAHKHKKVQKFKKVSVVRDGQPLSDEEMEEIMVEVRESLAEADEIIAETDVIVKEALAEAGEARTEVKMECKSDSKEVAEVVEGKKGRTVYLCQARVMAHALEGLREARSAIAENREIQGKMREQLLETLDEQIRTWERRSQG